MTITQRFKAAAQSFRKAENTIGGRDLSRDFMRNGNAKPLVQDWSKVVMSDKELYTGYPYAAINNRANKVAQLASANLKTDALKKIIDAAKAKQEDVLHPYLEIIDKSVQFPNTKFWYDISTYLDLEGVYYLMAIRTVAGDRIGNVQEFKLLNPYNVKRIRNKETLEIGGYVEAREGLVREIPTKMIIDIRKLNPFSEDDPFAMTDAAKESQFTLKQAGDYTRHSLKNNMAAPGIISTDVLLDPQQFANFVNRVTNQEKGLPLFGNGAGAITWDSMQIDLDKASLDNINEINRSTMMAVSGVGKTMMSIEESGTTRETAKAQKDIFVENHVMPQLQLILDALNQDYKVCYPSDYEVNKYRLLIDNPLGSDRDAELKDVDIRNQIYKVYDTLVGAGYTRILASKYAAGEITLEELGEPTNEPRPNPIIEAAMLKAGDTPQNDNVKSPKEKPKVEPKITPKADLKSKNELEVEENKGNPNHDSDGKFGTGSGGSKASADLGNQILQITKTKQKKLSDQHKYTSALQTARQKYAKEIGKENELRQADGLTDDWTMDSWETMDKMENAGEQMTRNKGKMAIEYNMTQAYFKAAGVKSVKLYRGVTDEAAKDIGNDLDNKGFSAMKPDYATSWSDSKAVAERFASDDGVVISREIPVSQIMTHWAINPKLNTFGENEFIVSDPKPYRVYQDEVSK